MAAQGSEWRSWKKAKTRAFLYQLVECGPRATQGGSVLAEPIVRCWDQFSVPQNKELCYRPQAQQSIVQHCMATGKSQLQAYKRTSASHCKHALVRGSQKQNPRGVRACGRTGKIPVVTHKNSFSKTGFLLSWSSLCRQSGLTQRSILPVS